MPPRDKLSANKVVSRIVLINADLKGAKDNSKLNARFNLGHMLYIFRIMVENASKKLNSCEIYYFYKVHKSRVWRI